MNYWTDNENTDRLLKDNCKKINIQIKAKANHLNKNFCQRR